MQQGSEYGSQYYGHQYPPYHPMTNPSPSPAPNPSEFTPPNPNHSVYASAPPYSHFPSPFPAIAPAPSPATALTPSPTPYASFSQHPDPVPTVPPSAPSYSQHQSQPQDLTPQFPSYAQHSSSLFQPEQSPAPASAPYSNFHQPIPAPYHPYDSHDNYALQQNPNPDPSQKPGLNPTPFSSVYAPNEPSYEGVVPRFDHGSGYYSENTGKYGMNASRSFGQSQPGYEDYYEKQPEMAFQYRHVGAQDDGLGDGVYAYDGGRLEPYGARGTVPRSSSSSAWGGFDDYGRSTSFSSGRNDQVGSASKITRAVPKAEAQQDIKNAVSKFRVKLLPEGSSINTIDVLCQIGLDGIRMLDSTTNRTLRIYTLETIIKWEVIDPSIFCFWSKSSVDNEPKRIRLKSNNYTTNTILDTVTAVSVQLKEMSVNDVGRNRGSADSSKPSEQPNEKKKGFTDWMIKKPSNEEKEHWVPDEAVTQCTSCGVAFGPFVRRHHCRNCGDIFCDKCSQGRIALTTDENAQQVRVCDACMAEVTQSLNIAKEAGNRSATTQSHEDLARKLKEEMERNRRPSSGSKSPDSSAKMREVACPTCTVHLQVQVPSSGSETIECGVCQHPFLVSAH